MANIADGYVSIESTNKEFLEDLKNKINDGPFSYGGPVDIMDMDHGLDAGFTGRWRCEDAWIFFEDLMANADYAFQQALIDSKISGSESEEGAREAKEISKQSGEALITRKDVSDEREWEEEEEEEEEEDAVITEINIQNLELIDSIIKACSDDPTLEPIASLCKAASDVMLEFYDASHFFLNDFRVIATFEGKKADIELMVSGPEIEAKESPLLAVAEWISDDLYDPLAITDIAELESGPTFDDFQSQITVFIRYSNGEDSEENPPSPEEVDVMETVASLISEAVIRFLFPG